MMNAEVTSERHKRKITKCRDIAEVTPPSSGLNANAMQTTEVSDSKCPANVAAREKVGDVVRLWRNSRSVLMNASPRELEESTLIDVTHAGGAWAAALRDKLG